MFFHEKNYTNMIFPIFPSQGVVAFAFKFGEMGTFSMTLPLFLSLFIFTHIHIYIYILTILTTHHTQHYTQDTACHGPILTQGSKGHWWWVKQWWQRRPFFLPILSRRRRWWWWCWIIRICPCTPAKQYWQPYLGHRRHWQVGHRKGHMVPDDRRWVFFSPSSYPGIPLTQHFLTHTNQPQSPRGHENKGRET